MKNPIKGALHIAKMRRLGKGPKIADLKGIESSPLMKQRRSIPYTERQPFALGGQPTQNVDATQQQPQNQAQQQPQPTAPAQMGPPTSVPSLISNLYNQYLGRNPNQEEVNYWQGQPSPENIYRGISTSGAAQGYYTGQYNPSNAGQYVSSLYQNYMGRAPNQDELHYWQDQLGKGVSPNQVYQTISNDIGSYANMYSQMATTPFASNTQWLNNVYQANMGRNANPEEQKYWLGQFDKGVSPDQVSSTIANDPGVIIPNYYRAYMGRDPNQDEMKYWGGQLANGVSPQKVEQAIAADVNNSLNPTEFITAEYNSLMGRDPSQDELNYWSGQLASGVSQEQIDNIISNDPSSQAYQASNFAPFQVASSSKRFSVPSRQGNFKATAAGTGFVPNFKNEDDAIVRATIAEAATQSDEGKLAVIYNILNRTLNGYHGAKNAIETILSPAQYSSFMKNNQRNNIAGRNAMNVPENSNLYQHIMDLVQKAKNGAVADPSGGNSHYANERTADAKSQAWRRTLTNVVNVGDHRFGTPRSEAARWKKFDRPYNEIRGGGSQAPIPQSQTPAVSGGGASGVGVGGSSGSATSPGSVGASSGTPAPPPTSGEVTLSPLTPVGGGQGYGGGRGLAPAELGPSSSIAPTNSPNFSVGYAPSTGSTYNPSESWLWGNGYDPWGQTWIDTWGAKDGGRIVSHQDRQNFALGGQPTENVDATQQQPQNQQQQVQQQPQQQQQQVASQTPMAPPTDRASLISNLYNQYLGRNPNQEEVGYWQGQASPEVIYQGISGSQAAKDYYTGQYNQANPQQYISSLYQNYMGRAPNQDEINYWQGQLSQGVNPSQVLNTISSDIGSRANMYSQMAAAPFASNTQWLNNVYRENMGRDATADEQQYWQGQFDKGVSPDQVASTIENDPGAAIPRLYRDYLGRDPNQDEFNYWQGEMKKGRSAGQVEQAIADDTFSNNFIRDEYQGLLGRDPNQDEINYWRGELGKGVSYDEIDKRISSDPSSQAYQASNFEPYQVAGSVSTPTQLRTALQYSKANDELIRSLPVDKQIGALLEQEGGRWISKIRDPNTPQSVKDQALRQLEGIVNVVMNRAAVGLKDNNGSGAWSNWFGKNDPKNVTSQILAPSAFSAMKIDVTKYARDGYNAILRSLENTRDAAYQPVQNMIEEVIANKRPDITNGATHYKANYVNPNWTRGRKALPLRTDLGGAPGGSGPYHQFYGTDANAQRASAGRGEVSFAPTSTAPAAILQETTPASGAGGGTYSDALATQNFLNDYLYDSNVPGTNVLNLGGGSSGGGPGGGSGSGGSSAGTPGSHAGTHGASAMPTVNHPVSHGSGSVSFAPVESYSAGYGAIDPYFGHSFVGQAPQGPEAAFGSGHYSYGPWSEGYYRYNSEKLGLKRGGSVTHDNIRKRGMDAVQAYASGGKVWEKKRPKSLGKPEKLDKDQKRSAKAAAKAAGRPYPNLIDNMRAAQKADGGEIKAAIKLAHKKLTKET